MVNFNEKNVFRKHQLYENIKGNFNFILKISSKLNRVELISKKL